MRMAMIGFGEAAEALATGWGTARAAGLDFIRLSTPTTDDKRMPTVLQNTSGFVYYVSVTGITGAQAAQAAEVGRWAALTTGDERRGEHSAAEQRLHGKTFHCLPPVTLMLVK